MSQPTEITFKFGDGSVHDASVDETSESQQICYQYGWSITPIANVAGGGVPDYTVQVSDDNVTWFNFSPASTGVPLNIAVERSALNFLYIRIVYDAAVATTGTIQFDLLLKQ